MSRHLLITGGAGYIGSLLSALMLAKGWKVTVVDSLLHGGDAILTHLQHPNFRFHPGDIRDQALLKTSLEGVDSVVHLAALVGFPVCKKAGEKESRSVNVEATRTLHTLAPNTERFVFASSHSNYATAQALGSETSPLNPQSLYAETKVEAEAYLLEQTDGPCTTCLRLATLFGLSPRTRFDLMVNQFSLTAHLGQKLVIYQKNFQRAFVHVRDVAEAIALVLEAPAEEVAGQVFNIGGEQLNSSKAELVQLVRQFWPQLEVEERELEFEGDMRSLHVSFEKVRRILGFVPRLSIEDGIRELHQALSNRLVLEPESNRHRNHAFVVT